jgi:hypothetical protein
VLNDVFTRIGCIVAIVLENFVEMDSQSVEYYHFHWFSLRVGSMTILGFERSETNIKNFEGIESPN